MINFHSLIKYISKIELVKNSFKKFQKCTSHNDIPLKSIKSTSTFINVGKIKIRIEILFIFF